MLTTSHAHTHGGWVLASRCEGLKTRAGALPLPVVFFLQWPFGRHYIVGETRPGSSVSIIASLPGKHGFQLHFSECCNRCRKGFTLPFSEIFMVRA